MVMHLLISNHMVRESDKKMLGELLIRVKRCVPFTFVYVLQKHFGPLHGFICTYH